MNLDEKIEKVENTIKNRKIAIAFSGGADSTLLTYLASKVSDKPIAITIDNHIFPTGFIKHCKKTAKEFGIKHKVIDLNFYEHENLLSNKSDRCFVCRDLMYGNIKKYATDNGYESVLDGNNISDLVLDRPGILITYKNNIESPFIHAKLTSKEIHEYLNKHNIPFSRSTTCLGTRLPTNTKMTPENIKQVSASEDFIYEKTNCEIVKVRNNNGLALCEVDDLNKILNENTLKQIKDKLKSIGFKKVALNLSEIDDDENITIDYSKGAFEYQLPYTIDIENTKNQLKDKSISSDSKEILIENQEIHENGLIKGSNFKSKEECLDKFMELLPDEQILFNEMKEKIQKSYEKFGFLPLDTPIIESADVLLAKAGGETEKQIYKFKKGENDLALRFDLTVPLAKYVAKNMGNLTFPFKRYQIGKVYRGERAQRGRFREFYQCDIDIIGDGELGIVNDAEIPSVIYNLISDLGFNDFTI